MDVGYVECKVTCGHSARPRHGLFEQMEFDLIGCQAATARVLGLPEV